MGTFTAEQDRRMKMLTGGGADKTTWIPERGSRAFALATDEGRKSLIEEEQSRFFTELVKNAGKWGSEVGERFAAEQKKKIENIQREIELAGANPAKAGDVLALEARKREEENRLKIGTQLLQIDAERNNLLATLTILEREGSITASQQENARGRINALDKQRLEVLRLQNVELRMQNTPATAQNAFAAGTAKFWQQNNMVVMENSIPRLKTTIEQMADAWASAMGAMNSSLSQLFVNLVSGTMKGREAVRQFASSVIQSMLKIVSEMASKQILQALFGLNGGGGILSSLFSSILGGGTAQPIVPAAPALYAHGGWVRAANGYGVKTRDSVPALLRPGEFVVRKTAADLIGHDTLNEINSLSNSVISRSPLNRQKTEDSNSGGGLVNVWVVSQDQLPPPGPKDIIATVAQDINSGGSIKSLIRQVQMGSV